MLRRSDIADHRASGINADTKSTDLLKIGGVFDVGNVDDAERAEAALKNHIGPLEDRHYAVAAEFVDVAAVLVNEIDLLGQQRADHRKQSNRFLFFRKRCEAAHIREADRQIQFVRRRESSSHRHVIDNLERPLGEILLQDLSHAFEPLPIFHALEVILQSRANSGSGKGLLNEVIASGFECRFEDSIVGRPR